MLTLSLLRSLNAAIDFVVYSVVNLFYQLFMLISSAGLFSQEIIQEFATRIYVFLGLIMVFKVSISLVSYILNPDNFAKADVGAPALLKGFVFALVGIVLVPYAFEAAYSLQRIILKDNLIGNLILGSSSTVNVTEDDIKNGGRNMAFTSLTAFIRLDTGILVNGEPVISEACASDPVIFEHESVTTSDSAEYALNDTGSLSTECSGLQELIGEEAVNLLVSAYSNRSIRDLTNYNLLNLTIKSDSQAPEYIITYTWLISTLAGAFMAYVFLMFCLDIAIRSVKLSFLQLIAPIPLISRIDPKKGKDLFGKWIKEVTSTYLDVFVRLIAIYFVLFVISALATSGNRGIYNVVDPNNEFTGVSGLLVKVFIILGALSFAKELPNILKNLFGLDLKASGGFTLNAKKKFGDVPLAGKPLLKTVGLAANTGANVAKGMYNAATKKTGFDTGEAIKNDFSRYGYEVIPFLGDMARKKQDAQVKALQTYAGYKNKLKEQADFDTTNRTFDFNYKDQNGNTITETATNANTKELKQALEDLKNSGTATKDEITKARTAYETSQKISISDADHAPIKLIKQEAARYAKDNADAFVGIKDEKGNDFNISTDPEASFELINSGSIGSSNKIVEVQSTTSYIRAHSTEAPKK